jgi:hypothetical protein
MIHYALINIFGWTLAVIGVIFAILSERGRIAPRLGNIIRIFFGIAFISYGIYVLSVKEILREVFPHERYTIGGWIMISFGLILLLISLWIQKNGKKGREL